MNAVTKGRGTLGGVGWVILQVQGIQCFIHKYGTRGLLLDELLIRDTNGLNDAIELVNKVLVHDVYHPPLFSHTHQVWSAEWRMCGPEAVWQGDGDGGCWCGAAVGWGRAGCWAGFAMVVVGGASEAAR